MTTKRHRAPKPIQKLLKAPRPNYPSFPRLLQSWKLLSWCFRNREAGWVALPKWQQRYKALRRSARNHGRKFGIIDALERVQREWEAQG